MWVLENIITKQVYFIDHHPFVIGRDLGANIPCLNVQVSKKHAIIFEMSGNNNNSLFIMDKSTNGTYINCKRLKYGDSCIINDGDEIGISICKSLPGYPDRFQHPLYIFILKNKSNNVMSSPLGRLDAGNVSGETNNKNLSNDKLASDLKVITKAVKECSEVVSLLENSDKNESKEKELNYKNELENAYSENDHIIVIDDDDDDNQYDRICSQFFVKEEIKDEANEDQKDDVEEGYEHDVENFDFIKKELEELNQFDSAHEVAFVDLISDEEVNDSDELKGLLNILDDPVISQAAAQVKETESIGDGMKSEENALKNLVEKSSAQFYEIPPKRRRISHSDTKKTSKVNNSKTANSDTEKVAADQYKLARKEKLKDLATKSTNEKFEHNLNRPKKSYGTAKIKTSNGRGDFLLDPIPGSSSNIPNNKKKQKSTFRIPKKTQKDSKEFATVKPSSSPIYAPVLNVSNSERDNVPKSTFNLVEGPSPNVYKDTSNSNFQMINSHRSIIEQFEDVVVSILHWNWSWFEEYKEKRKIPEKITKKPLVRLPNIFENFTYYKNTFTSILLVELWVQAYRDYQRVQYQLPDQKCNRFGSNTFAAAISEIRRQKKYTELICNTYLEPEVYKQGKFIRENDIVVITVEYALGRSNVLKTVFGLNVSNNITPLQITDRIDITIAKNCSTPPKYKQTFLLLIRNDVKVNKDFLIYGRYFKASLNNFLLFKTIDLVGGGPLEKQLLQPNVAEFFVEKAPLVDLIPMKFYKLNEVQHQIVSDACAFFKGPKTGLFLIDGPPGTGKSFVIINIILQTLYSNPKDTILLLAPSNVAIDNLVCNIGYEFKRALPKEKQKCLRVVRIGHIGSISAKAAPFSLDELVKRNLKLDLFVEHPELRNDYDLLDKEIKDLKSIMYKGAQDETRLKNALKKYENYIYNCMPSQYAVKRKLTELRVLQSATIICSTIGSCHKLFASKFDGNIKFCIIDEATQATEPETLIPLNMKVEKCILVGDTNQLPAVSTMIPKELECHRSLFARMKYSLEKNPTKNPIRSLTRQYRMLPEISQFPNKTFYNGTVLNMPLDRVDLTHLKPYAIFALEFSQKINDYKNLDEIDTVYEMLLAIIAILKGKTRRKFSIGIITPYVDQRNAVNEKLLKIQSLNENLSICCNTVDGFQGKEKDIIIVSCVRNLSNSFLNDHNRLNVALTRARYALYIIGSQSLFQTSPILLELKKDAQSRQVYHDLKNATGAPTFQRLLIRDNANKVTC